MSFYQCRGYLGYRVAKRIVGKIRRIVTLYNAEFLFNKFTGRSFSPNKIKVLYVGWLGFRNFGDEILLDSIRKLLGKDFKIYDYSKVNHVFLKGEWEEDYFDCLMLGGGTLINQYKAWLDIVKTKKSNISNLIVFGTGVANKNYWSQVNNWENRLEEWKEQLSDCKFLGVRGPTSLEFLQSVGLKNGRVVGDPVLFLGEDNVQVKKQQKKIGINFGVTGGAKLWGGDDSELARQIILICKELLGQGWDISFFSVMDEDTLFIKQCLKEYLPDREFDIYDAWRCKASDAFKYFANIDVFIAEKLHAGIAAACTYTPFLMFEYRPKCMDFMKSINCEEFTVRTDQIEIDNVVEDIQRLYTNSTEYQQKLFDSVGYYKNELNRFARNIQDSFH